MLMRFGNRDTANKTQKYHGTSKDGLWNNDSKAAYHIKSARRVLGTSVFSAGTPGKNPNTFDGNAAPKHRALAGHHSAPWANTETDKLQRESMSGTFLHPYTVSNNENKRCSSL